MTWVQGLELPPEHLPSTAVEVNRETIRFRANLATREDGDDDDKDDDDEDDDPDDDTDHGDDDVCF